MRMSSKESNWYFYKIKKLSYEKNNQGNFSNFYPEVVDAFILPSTLWYMSNQIPILKFFSSRLAVIFVQSIETWNLESDDAVGAAPIDDAPTASEWSTILLPIKVWLILEVSQ